MTDIQPGDCVIITARVDDVVIHSDGRVRVKIDTDEIRWVDADRCMVVGKDEA